MKKGNNGRTIRNLVISVLITIAGIAITLLSYAFISFRYNSGYSIPVNEYIACVKAFAIIVLEGGTTIVGGLLTIFGFIGIFSNVKKLMR